MLASELPRRCTPPSPSLSTCSCGEAANIAEKKSTLSRSFSEPSSTALASGPWSLSRASRRLVSRALKNGKKNGFDIFRRTGEADALLTRNNFFLRQPAVLRPPAPILAFLPRGRECLPPKNKTSGAKKYHSPWSPHLELTQECRIVARDRPACRSLPYSPGHLPFPFRLVPPNPTMVPPPSTSATSGSIGRHGGGEGGEAGGAPAFRDGRAAAGGCTIVVRVAAACRHRTKAGSKEGCPRERVGLVGAREQGRGRTKPVRLCCEVRPSCLASGKLVFRSGLLFLGTRGGQLRKNHANMFKPLACALLRGGSLRA